MWAVLAACAGGAQALYAAHGFEVLGVTTTVPEPTYRRVAESTAEWIVPEGQYYMLGDNRGASADSREWGPVPRDYMIGNAFATYWPPNRISLR